MIELNVDKLVLEGFAIEDGEKIKAAVEQVLTRLLVDHGVSTGKTDDVNVARLKGGQIEIKSGANAAHVGKQIAWGIYGAIKP